MLSYLLKNVINSLNRSGYDSNIIEAAEERESEVIDGVKTKVLFPRLMLTPSYLSGLMTPVAGIDTVGILEVILGNMTWLYNDSLVFVK